MDRSYCWRISGLLASVALLVGWAPAAFAQPASGDKEILLGQGFVPNPVAVAGNSGGQFPATRVIAREQTPTGLCLGYISSLPNHTLTLETFFSYLSVTVDSNKDTTLVVQGPGGIWCSDDVQGHNPAIEGQWQPGTYQIWVGAYSPDQAANYILQIQDSDINVIQDSAINVEVD